MNIATLLAQGEALQAAVQPKQRLDVPRSFVAFCIWIGIALSVGQTVIAKVAYDGVDPCELDGEERDVAREIFGPIETVSAEARSTFVAVCGGRAGKSHRLVALRLVWGMFTRDLSSLAPGQHPAALVVAPNDTLRQEVVNYAIGAIRSKAELRATLIVPKGTSEDGVVSGFSIRRDDAPAFANIVDFVAGVATRGGYGGRGRAWTDAALDECAFLQDSSHKVNDKDIFDAAKARVLPGGQSILASTPWAEAGLLYEQYAENFGKPTSALVAQAPTLTLNPSPMAQSIVARETQKDPENAAREYGAKFMKGGTTVFFPPTLIDACIDDTLDPLVPRLPAPGDDVAAGSDLGFRSDSSALAITHLVHEKHDAEGNVVQPQRLLLAELLEKRPEPGKPLKPGATCREFRDRMQAHGAKTLMADQHYIETAREELDEAGLTVISAPATPDDVYVRARQRMREGIVRFARHERLIQQLKEVQGKPLPGGKMQIILPRWAKGGHGDAVSAFVLGLWQLVPDTVPKPKPDETSEEAALERKKARFEQFKGEAERPHWRSRGGAADRGANAHWRRA